jgi:hypothetical protein
MTSLYEVLKASRIPSAASDMYTALWAKALTGGSPTPSEHQYTGAVPVTITANGQPLIDYLISGNMEQSGTPTQEATIQPQGTGERTGNLWDGDYTVAVMSASGNTATLNTTSSGRTAIVKCEPNTTYTVKKYSASNRFIIAESDIKPVNGTAMSIIQNNSSISEYTFTTSSTTQYVVIYCSTSSEQAEPQLMLNTGSTPLPYEPYGIKIPISSAGQTNNIYLGEVETTRQIRKLVLTGEETYVIYTYSNTSGIQVQNVLDTAYKRANGICNIYPVATTSGTTHCLWIGSGGSDRNLYLVSILDDMGLQGAAAFKTWVTQQYNNGTPVTVWYVLAEPETGIVNEPLMRIGDYADTISMEQAGVSIPTLNGQTVIDVDTTLKPSEVYIKYQG